MSSASTFLWKGVNELPVVILQRVYLFYFGAKVTIIIDNCNVLGGKNTLLAHFITRE